MTRTAECVTPKHPDKQCDQISDAILDEALRQDPDSRVAVEVMGGHGSVIVIGEMTTNAFVDVEKIVKRITGISPLVKIVKQSHEIAKGVDTGGAGDQGIMVGYACNKTPEMLPLEVSLARHLCKYIFAREPYDGKTQVTIEGEEIKSIVASFQNVPKELLESLIKDWLRAKFGVVCSLIQILANPAGDWEQGEFNADTGLTGRKIIIDAYGPGIAVGGGAFSGKDPTKVDRSAAYMARKIAVQLLREHEDAEEVYVYLAYAIGKAEPLQSTAVIDGKEFQIGSFSSEVNSWDLTPQGIIKALDLKKPIYEETAKWGHFGNGFPWDK